ncbi:agmatine coumaroyltransferase-2 [Amborella trichopoda]|uniref:Uncharacterized protein n=1 Tax=Amborella trichopoda TaxID=13333 RepID=W1NUN8_AMBTC|nr:agmatine coumaroyltransferase-2 [Amborella trichopoda]ERN01342.1 hypothetical protein AMTR_s00002p00257740 [Amborella trichopoda]|eukprot:XP_006838773.1 agmatine coumaroyltransferase-2 [Amborella trichopoda]
MKIQQQSSKLVTPSYENKSHVSSTSTTTPLGPFDRAAGDFHVPMIFAYKDPTPPNSTLEHGLSLILADYREWAGRLTDDRRTIIVNDKGVPFIEAMASCTLDEAMPLESNPQLLDLHPSLKCMEELLQVQLTRFTCGSLVVGCTTSHLVADGQAVCFFLIAWGKATRGQWVSPTTMHCRAVIQPREPLSIEFDHLGVEYTEKRLVRDIPQGEMVRNLRLHKAHFSPDFLARLKGQASLGCTSGRGYSTVESLVAHLWQKVAQLSMGRSETSRLRMTVNVHSRLVPPIPKDYFGNMVLLGDVRIGVSELLSKPLHQVAEVVRAAIAKVNDRYARSFVDFDAHIERHGDWSELVPTPELDGFCPNLEVNSWLGFAFDDMDFGSGGPHVFLPSCLPDEGVMVIMPPMHGKRGIDIYLPLSDPNKALFQRITHSPLSDL